MKITKSQLRKVIREAKKLTESLSREQIENYLRDVADGMAGKGLNPQAVKMGLNDEFMDNFAGMGVPHGAFEEFIEELSQSVGAGVRVEHKKRITKSQLRKIIKEELLKEATWLPNDAQYPRELLSNVSKSIDWDVGQAFAFVVDLLEDVNAHAEAKQINDLLLQGQEQDSPRYETSAEADLAKFQKDRFGKKGNHASAVMADYKSDY